MKRKCKITSPENFLHLTIIDEALQVNLAYKISKIMKDSRASKDRGNKKDFVNSLYALDVVNVSLAHNKYITFFLFMERVLSYNEIKCQNNRENLKNLCLLYGLTMLY